MILWDSQAFISAWKIAEYMERIQSLFSQVDPPKIFFCIIAITLWREKETGKMYLNNNQLKEPQKGQ